MAEYSESAKQNIGELVLKIRDLEVELARQKTAGESLVRSLRALADFFDPDNKGIELVHVKQDEFVTTHPINRHHDRMTMFDGNRRYPSFTFPDDYKECLKRIFDLEVELSVLRDALERAKDRAR